MTVFPALPGQVPALPLMLKIFYTSTIENLLAENITAWLETQQSRTERHCLWRCTQLNMPQTALQPIDIGARWCRVSVKRII